MFLLLFFTVFYFSGCEDSSTKTQALSSASITAPSYLSYRDIPGLRDEEIQAIEALRKAGVSFVYGTLPGTESFYGQNGVVQGYSALFCGWLSDLFGITFKPRIYQWDQLLAGLESGEIDFTGELSPGFPYRQHFTMTGPITDRRVKRFFIAENREPSLAGEAEQVRRYGFLENSPVQNLVSPYLYEPFTAVTFKNHEPVYQMLKDGEIDAFFEVDVAEPVFENRRDVTGENFFPLVHDSTALGTGKSALTPFVSVVQKYLNQGGDYYLTALYNQGTEEYRKYRFYSRLTPEEWEYLGIHQNPSAIIPITSRYDCYPLSFYNEQEQQWQGIALDILREIRDLTGMSFYPANLKTDEWYEIVAMLESGGASMACELIVPESLEGNFIRADAPYQRDRYAFLSKASFPDINVNEVRYSRVGLVVNSLYSSLFHKWFPDHAYTNQYLTITDAIGALDRGAIDLLLATTNTLFMIANYQERAGFKANLVLEQAHGSFFYFHKNERVLRSIVSKAQGFVDTEKIVERWTYRVFDYRGKMARMQIPYLIGLSAMLGAILILLAVMHARSRHGKKRLEIIVGERTRELEVQTELAKAASQAKSQFLASMSHEIRTPMNAIIGMSDLMRTDNLDEVQQGYFKDIKKMSKSLLQIINDILDFSKIEAGRLEITPVHFNVTSLYDNICSMSKFTALAKELEFKSFFDPLIPSVIYGDEIRIRQIITNIVNNAVKYTPQGSVSLSFSRAVGGQKDFLVITVEDTGIGIKEEDMPKLFDTFQQLDREKNRGIVGTGLGLSITKNLIALMEGEIKVESVYGKGSVFTVSLPLVEGDAEKIERKGIAERVNAAVEVAVLVVDDNPINLTVAQGFLATHNIYPDTAQSGREAIKMVREKRYDLIFMDHMMPEMDGIEAAQAIRALDSSASPSIDPSWFREMPIVALSANAVSGARESFLQGGMNDFVSKPIDAEQLNMALQKWLPKDKIAIVAQEKPKDQGADEHEGIFGELAGIEDMDMAVGLSHVGNNKTAYLQILRQFCAEYEGYASSIERRLNEENWQDYTIKLHAMKGVFANIGADAISKWAYQLEYASRNGDYAKCREESRPFIARMFEFKQKLLATSLMPREEEKEKRQVEAAELLKTLEALREACGQGMSDEADALAELLKEIRFSDSADPLIADICELIASLDYDLAIEKVEAIKGLAVPA
jgi:signal transduction histidine kinase/CheY-like chemotaxis protein/HPt (histidine-containing phosphotransfer) domain-containing protein/ABC-type amino acid transport substrate-binding protein